MNKMQNKDETQPRRKYHNTKPKMARVGVTNMESYIRGVTAVDETVVGAAPERWTTAGMKREDGMQGSRSEAVDERGQSLVMDGGVGVSAPAWWRRTAVDGVADGGRRRRVGWRGCFGAHGVRMGKREVERKGGTMYSGRACLKCEEFTNLAPVSNFYYITATLVGWG